MALLTRGSIALNSGSNPAKAIYNESLTLGYKKPVKEKPVSNLEQIANNRAKSAGMAATTSSGASRLTIEQVEKMTNAQRMNLTQADWDALEE